MQRVKSNEPTNPSNEQRSSIREEMQKFGLDQHTCSASLVKQSGYVTEAQLLVTALNFFRSSKYSCTAGVEYGLAS